jgi:serine protease Do
MNRKTLLTAVGLIFIGAVIGVIIVTGVRFTGEIPAQDNVVRTVTLGEANTVPIGPVALPAGSSFVDAAKSGTMAVVSIRVIADPSQANDLGKFHNFQQKQPEADAESEDEPADQGEGKEFFHWFFNSPGEPVIGSGSGVIISSDGYIITNDHVIKDAVKDRGILVTLNDKREFPARLIGSDPLTDVAIIKVDATGLPVTKLGNSDKVQVGEWVIAVGNPFQLTSTVTAGIVSAVNRNINIIRDNYGVENFIQTDAAINPGNSGGALLNINGELIGINTAIATRNGAYQGYGFAVPINLASIVAQDLIRYGKVRRGYIGVSLGSVDATMAKALGLQTPGGVLIQEVLPGSAAEEAGIRQMDVILSIDGVPVKEQNELQAYVARKHPEDVLILKVWRNQKEKELKVHLKPRKEDEPTAQVQPEPAEEEVGIDVANLSEEDRKDYELSYGVRVTGVDPYGTAFERGIEENDFILEINRNKVTSAREFENKLSSFKSGEAALLLIRKPSSKSPTFVAVEIPKQ